MRKLWKKVCTLSLAGIMALSVMQAVIPQKFAYAEGVSREDSKALKLNEQVSGSFSGRGEHWYSFDTGITENGVDSWFLINTVFQKHGGYVYIYDEKGIELDMLDIYLTGEQNKNYIKLDQEKNYYLKVVSGNAKGADYFLELEEIADEGGETMAEAAAIKNNQAYRNSIYPGAYPKDYDWFYVESDQESVNLVLKNSGNVDGSASSGYVYIRAYIYDIDNTELAEISVAKNSSETKSIKVPDGQFYIKIDATSTKGLNYVLTVKEDVEATTVKLNKSNYQINKGKSATLKASFTPGNAMVKLSWKTSNKKVVTVDKNGKIKALAKGKATITVTDIISGNKATCKITVK
ncbi:Ig-like domain-containing protein [Variimorphobacter saccharofermentans]|nr:Ig-like domain-containing protein [Variimorphobacter saccharofermentans]